MPTDKSRAGFTIIELVMLIAIVGIFAVLAITRFRPYYPVKLNAAASKMKADIRYAQQLALSTQTDCGVIFYPASESYSVYKGNTATPATDPLTRNNMTTDFTADPYAGINLVSTNFGDTLKFDQRGQPADSGGSLLASSGTVQLSYSGNTQTVTIEPETGRVTTP